jgi:Peptidase A4 family
MDRRWLGPLAGLALAVGSLVVIAPAGTVPGGRNAVRTSENSLVSQRVLQPRRPFQPALGTRPVVVDGRRIVYSTNWSGYAVIGSTFTTATASWTQVAITCKSGDGLTDMSPWVGIDGYGDNTVEQTGSSGDCDGSTPDYYAWYEMYPRPYVVIDQTVRPGDQFTATVTHTTGKKYVLMLEDVTEGWTNTVTQKIEASDSSAEAVMEMAAKSLSQFSTDRFSDFTVDGQPIGSYTSSPYTIEQMEIKVGGTLCDSTSNLRHEEDFTVAWLNAC